MAIPPVPGKKLNRAKAAPKKQPQHSASAKKKAAAKQGAARKVPVKATSRERAETAKQSPKPRPVTQSQPNARRVPVPPDSPIPVVAGKAKRHHAHKGLHRALIGMNVFLVLCVVATGGGYAYLKFRLGQLDRISIGCALRNCGADDPDEPMNVLLVGSDTRANISKAEQAKFGNEADVGGERTDTMMVLHVDPRAEKASILSIPRDLYVPIAGTRITDRINTAFALETNARSTATTRSKATATTSLAGGSTIPASAIKDGASRLIATIRQNLGIEIDHYMEVDFNSFRSIVNAVGGVTVPFPAPARDKLAGLDVKTAGCVALSGDQALAYVRSRHFQYFESGRWRTDPTGDIGRIQRQQDFIRRMLRKAISKGARNPIKLNSLINAGVGNVKLDSALSSKDLFRIGKQFKSLAPEAVDMLTLPVDDFRTSAGAAVLKVRSADAREIIDRFNGVGQEPATTPAGAIPNISPVQIRVLVLNGTGVNGQAGQVQRSLSGVGFGTGGVGDAPGGFGKANTEIRYGEGQLQKAQVLEAYVVGGAKLVKDTTLKGGDIQLIVGGGYGGIRSTLKPVTGSTSSIPATTSTTRGPVPTPKGAAALAC